VYLTAILALTFTASITAYAPRRGRSPLLWGGASLSITVFATLLASVTVQRMGSTDLVFTARGGGLAMLAVLIGPVVAVIGNLLLVGRLIALPMVRSLAGSSWLMWRVADSDEDGCACRLSVNADAIVATRGADELFSIANAHLTAVEVVGESLLLRCADGRQIRLLLASGDPNDRNARIDEITAIKRAIERITRGQAAIH
jgi:hypothetical protein